MLDIDTAKRIKEIAILVFVIVSSYLDVATFPVGYADDCLSPGRPRDAGAHAQSDEVPEPAL